MISEVYLEQGLWTRSRVSQVPFHISHKLIRHVQLFILRMYTLRRLEHLLHNLRWSISKQLDLLLTPSDPMTFYPNIALHFGQEFFLPNLVAIEHSWAIWPLADPGWPLHKLWPQQCITLRAGVLTNKFCGHKAFLKQLDLWMTFDLWRGRFENMLSNLVGLSSTPMPSFSSITPYDETHSRTYIHKRGGYILTYRLGYFSSIDILTPPSRVKKITSSCDTLDLAQRSCSKFNSDIIYTGVSRN